MLRLGDTGLGELASSSLSVRSAASRKPRCRGADGSQRFQVELPVGVGAPLGWEFRAVDIHGREHRVSWPTKGDQGQTIGGGSGDACWQRSITGYCNLMSDWAVAEAENVTVAEDGGRGAAQHHPDAEVFHLAEQVLPAVGVQLRGTG